jgi:CheY-like chemotaxis protein
MSASILVVDDEPDVAGLFRRESRQGKYVMHFEATNRLRVVRGEPRQIVCYPIS